MCGARDSPINCHIKAKLHLFSLNDLLNRITRGFDKLHIASIFITKSDKNLIQSLFILNFG